MEKIFIKTLTSIMAILTPSYALAAALDSSSASEPIEYETKGLEISAFLKDHFAGKQISPNGRLFVTKSANGIEAVVQAVVHENYPLTQTYELYVPERAWKNQTGAALLTYVMQRHEGKIHRVLVPANDLLAIQNMVPLGFQLMRTTWIAEIDVDAAIKLCKGRRVDLSPFPIKALGNRPNDAVLKNWVKAHARHYQATHLINPISEQSDAGWRLIFAGDDFVPSDSFYAIDKGAVIAHSSLRKDGDQWWFGWLGTSPRLPAVQVTATNLAMAWAVVNAARAKGARSIMIEADSTDPQAKQVMDFLPHRIKEELLMFQTGIPQ